MILLVITHQSDFKKAGIGNGAIGPNSMCYLHMEQIAQNLMCHNGTKTQQSAEIGNGAIGPSSTCYLHTEQIAPNLMCSDGMKPNNQQGLEMGQKDQALH
eukprot:13570196-Ditylum_brightwellii.AAC.1